MLMREFDVRPAVGYMPDGEVFIVGSITAIIGALVGALVGYILALRTVRRQRQHEVKQEAYGTLLPLVEETIGLMGWIQGFQSLSLDDDKKFVANLIQLVRPTYLLGDRDAFLILDQLEDGHDLKNKKGRQEFLEEFRTYTITFLLMQSYSNIREVRLQLGSLRFSPAKPEVTEALNKVLGLLAGDELSVGMRGMLRHTDFAAALPEVDWTARAKAYNDALTVLARAISEELSLSL